MPTVMDVDVSSLEINTIQLAVEFVIAWLSVQFKYFNTKKNRNSYFESQRTQMHNIKHQIGDVFKWFHQEFFVHFFAKYGLKLVKIVFVDAAPNSATSNIASRSAQETVENVKIEFFETEKKKDLAQQIKLYRAKEVNLMSDNAYQNFINEGAQFGSLRFAKKCRFILNRQFKCKTNDHGVYNIPEEKIKYFFQLHKDKFEIRDNTIHIRLAGDGTNIGNNYTVENFSFSFLNKHGEMNARSVTGIFLLGVFKIKSECYSSLREALRELVELLKNTNEINIDGVKYKIEYWLGGDMKFLLLVLGLNAANSDSSCIWCQLSKSDFSKMIRTHTMNRKVNDKSKGQINYPIIDFIKIENIIVDPLHMYLRIADKLISLLHKSLESLDGAFSLTLELNPNFNKYITFLQKIGIRNPYWIEQKKFKLRALNGDDKRRLFSKINLTELFPEMAHVVTTNKLWKEMHQIMECIRADDLNTNQIKTKTNNWLECFLSLNFATEVTPYAHVFSSHVYQQVENLKSKNFSLNDFSMQGVEKYNDFSTQYFHRSTNKKGDVEVQLIKKRNRVELLKHHPFIVELISDNINKIVEDSAENETENAAYSDYEATIMEVINQQFEDIH